LAARRAAWQFFYQRALHSKCSAIIAVHSDSLLLSPSLCLVNQMRVCVSAAYPVTPKVLATALCGNNSMSGEDSLSHKSILVLQYAVLLCVCVFRGVFLVFAQKKNGDVDVSSALCWSLRVVVI